MHTEMDIDLKMKNLPLKIIRVKKWTDRAVVFNMKSILSFIITSFNKFET